MNVLITGAHGQLGRALVRRAPAFAAVVAYSGEQLDISDAATVDRVIRRQRPDLLLNAAAFTKVDAAETQVELADAINRRGVANLAAAASEVGAKLAHVSTDFVFDGQSSTPYRPYDRPSPLNVYGASKLGGEAEAGPDALILRTGWVYAAGGGNFVSTMLRLMRERKIVQVVDDQIGTPTSADALADALWFLAAGEFKGIWHYSDSGVASWYDFAVAIMEEAVTLGLLDRAIELVPISSSQYPTPARRPCFSVLDKSETYAALGSAAPHWRVNLRKMLKAIKTDG